MMEWRSIGFSITPMTALAHGLTVATRNTRDFQQAGAKVFDPFA
jgi:predicted nucleic acid-binding protein